ncbi:MAG: 5-formyltetrahydrofolate cyclo-ligase [Aquiluna sp.]|nr:5-formyltetrahydrofolate cyclo-ligase [Aquiluna sp.]MCF8545402.1 5-formyltetrahydrofolate cyclo-ligase [Aquiluna sp.]
MEIKAEKARLRAGLIAARPHSSQGLYENLWMVANELLGRNPSAVIATYSSTPSEPDMTGFNAALEDSSAIVAYPKVVGENLEFAVGPLCAGSFGIPEPTGQVIAIETIDLFLIPAVAADKNGNRIGKGRGFYDRLLEKISRPVFAIVFDEEFLEKIPVQEFDQRISGLITPSAIHRF